MAKGLGKNPLLAEEIKEDPVTVEPEVEEEEDVIVPISFRVRERYLKKLRNYAYTNRIELKEAFDEALGAFLNPIPDDTLVEYLEKPKKKRGPRK